ncbi:MAG: FecR family protein [Tannerellaceae bacterium]|jgi:ferric-dicitrate binding protein FerR (iron transport regulator)|nr:FecR family protein [Tannerellaceae bacterium]
MKEDISHIISKVLSNEGSLDEISTFGRWLAQSEDNISEFEKLKCFWDAKVDNEKTICRELSFISLQERIQKKKKRRHYFLYKFSVACSILLIIGFSSIFYFMNRNTGEKDTFYREYKMSAGKGQRASATLSDGTVVWLNSDTEITYSEKYGTKERVVFLNGEAFFEVAKNKELPFIVKIDGLNIEALGTSFNVKAYRTDKFITTTLFSGSVRTTTANEEVILYPNQVASYNKKDGTLSSCETSEAYHAHLWKNGELFFSGETLEEIGIVLERVYNIRIEFLSEDVKKLTFTGTIKNNGLKNVLDIISMTAPIEYVMSDSTIRIKLISSKKFNLNKHRIIQ